MGSIARMELTPIGRLDSVTMRDVAKALGDPIRLQLVDVLRKHAGKVCVCELVPLFDISQPTLSHHLGKLRAAGIVDSEKVGRVRICRLAPQGLSPAESWLAAQRSRWERRLDRLGDLLAEADEGHLP